MTVRFISDLHFGHNHIVTFAGKKRGNVKTLQEHDEWLIESFNSVVTDKRDVTWILGDAAFNAKGYEQIKKLNGIKHLVMGNHDERSVVNLMQYFHKIKGFHKRKGMWLSHCPIREDELRGKINVHGHTHSDQLLSDCGKYVCVCVEALKGKPISEDEIHDLLL